MCWFAPQQDLDGPGPVTPRVVDHEGRVRGALGSPREHGAHSRPPGIGPFTDAEAHTMSHVAWLRLGMAGPTSFCRRSRRASRMKWAALIGDVQALEPRVLLATYTVKNTNDTG